MIVNCIIYLFTFSFYITLLYLRINKKLYQIPLDVENITKYYEYLYKFLLFSISIIILLAIILLIKYLILAKIKRIETQYKKDKIKNKFIINLKKVVTWFDNIKFVSKTYGLIFEFIGPEYTKHLITLARHCLKMSVKKTKIICFLGIFLPRLLIIIVFLIDIFVVGTLQYYFYSLFLLLIPLIFNFVLFTLKDLGPRVLPELKKFVLLKESSFFVEVQTIDGPKKLWGIYFELAPEYSDMDLDSVLHYFYYPVLHITGYMQYKVSPIATKFTQYSLLFYYFFHVIGLSYILFYIT